MPRTPMPAQPWCSWRLSLSINTVFHILGETRFLTPELEGVVTASAVRCPGGRRLVGAVLPASCRSQHREGGRDSAVGWGSPGVPWATLWEMELSGMATRLTAASAFFAGHDVTKMPPTGASPPTATALCSTRAPSTPGASSTLT